MRTPTWSVPSQSALSSKTGSDNKAPVSVSLKVEGAAVIKSGLAPQVMSRIGVGQAVGGSPSQSVNHIQHPSMGTTHAEIGKIVQKLLLPRVSERPTWSPPSRDYMNKALTCQMCMSTATDIDSILICDACEKGYHLKCLHTTNQKGVPRGEWHCAKCLSLSLGKPIPPKYGRVMRNVNTPKVSSNSAAVQSTSSKSGVASDEKCNQRKIVVNDNTTMKNTLSGVAGKNLSHPTSGAESSRGNLDDRESSGTHPNDLMKTSSSASVSSANALAEKIIVDKVAESKPNSSAEIVMVANSSDKSGTIVNPVEASPSKQSLENHYEVRDSKESHCDESPNNTNHLKEQEAIHDNSTRNAPSAGTMNEDRSSSDGLRAVKWVGDPIQVSDEKIYYASCCINGHLYKAMDHVLIRFQNDKLIPSKLLVSNLLSVHECHE